MNAPEAGTVLFLFLLSGFCALVYEIVWLKQLTLVIGNTVYSVSIVLTAFMGGLALGSFAAGRLIHRARAPLRVYGVLEALIGVFALLVPLLIDVAQPLFRFVYQHPTPGFPAFGLVRFVVCLLILLVPTTLMGATLPVLSGYLAAEREPLGWTIGRLYGLNTLGAMFGAFAAGFVLIPAIGLSRTTYVAALLNGAIGAVAFRRSRARIGTRPVSVPSVPPDQPVTRAWTDPTALAVLVGIALSGAAALIYQVAWTRVLTLLIGSSVYAFTLIVTAFIAGLASGSLAGGRLARPRRDLVLGLSLVQVGIALSALAIAPLMGALPPVIVGLVTAQLQSFGGLNATELALVFALLLVPTFLMGASFPLATAIYARDAVRVGRKVGDLYSANTIGAIVGAVATGLALIPWLGTERTVFVAVAVNLAAAAMIFLVAPTGTLPRRVAALAVASLLITAGCQMLPPRNAFLLSAGPYLYGEEYQQLAARKGIPLAQAMTEERQLLFFKEGLHAAVTVTRTADGDLMLGVDGKTDGTARADAPTQLLVGHLPLLLHPGAETALVIGLGTGMTLGAVERHPLKSIDVAEIEPAVVTASSYFRPSTGASLGDPRLKLVLADGRNYLSLTDRRYDVIISEPSNPWVAGMANLFTREFFESARGHLTSAGIMCAWVHAYSMSPANFKTILRTFTTVFPNTTLWEADLGNDYLLVGSTGDGALDASRVRSQLARPALRADLAAMNISDPASLVSKLVMDAAGIAGFTAGASLNTDDNARLEYSAPRGLLGGRSTALLAELYGETAPASRQLAALGWINPPREVAERLDRARVAKQEVVAGYIGYANADDAGAVGHLDRALALDPTSYQAAYLLARVYNDAGDREFDALTGDQGRASYAKSVGVVEQWTNGATEALTDHFVLAATYAQASLHLGVLLLRAGELGAAEQALLHSLASGVRYPEAHNNLGVVREKQGQYAAALEQYTLALKDYPGYVAARMNVGNSYLREGRFAEASARYREVLRDRPDFAPAHFNLGVVYSRQQQWRAAAAEWERALELRPDFPEATTSLAIARDSLRTR